METVLEILDRAEGVLRRNLARLPALQRQAVERDVLGLLKMARAALPLELRQATQMLHEAERTLALAREEARRVVLDAQAHARAQPGGAAPPSARAQTLIEDAQREAERIRRGADDYARGVLERLETEVSRLLGAIKRGQEVLRATNAQGRRGE